MKSKNKEKENERVNLTKEKKDTEKERLNEIKIKWDKERGKKEDLAGKQTNFKKTSSENKNRQIHKRM